MMHLRGGRAGEQFIRDLAVAQCTQRAAAPHQPGGRRRARASSRPRPSSRRAPTSRTGTSARANVSDGPIDSPRGIGDPSFVPRLAISPGVTVVPCWRRASQPLRAAALRISDLGKDAQVDHSCASSSVAASGGYGRRVTTARAATGTVRSAATCPPGERAAARSSAS